MHLILFRILNIILINEYNDFKLFLSYFSNIIYINLYFLFLFFAKIINIYKYIYYEYKNKLYRKICI